MVDNGERIGSLGRIDDGIGVGTFGRIGDEEIGQPAQVVSFQRIKISTSLVATSSAYEFPINPFKIDSLENLNKAQINIINNSPVWQIALYDGRPRILYWEQFLQSDIKIQELLNWLRMRRGQIKYINFNNLNNIIRDWPNATANGYWKKCRIIDVETSIQPGGQIRYEEIKLIIQPEK